MKSRRAPAVLASFLVTVLAAGMFIFFFRETLFRPGGFRFYNPFRLHEYRAAAEADALTVQAFFTAAGNRTAEMLRDGHAASDLKMHLVRQGRISRTEDAAVFAVPAGILLGLPPGATLFADGPAVPAAGNAFSSRVSVRVGDGVSGLLFYTKTRQDILVGRLEPEALFRLPPLMRYLIPPFVFLSLWFSLFLFMDAPPRADSLTGVRLSARRRKFALIRMELSRALEKRERNAPEENIPFPQVEGRREDLRREFRGGAGAEETPDDAFEVWFDLAWQDLLTVVRNRGQNGEPRTENAETPGEVEFLEAADEDETARALSAEKTSSPKAAAPVVIISEVPEPGLPEPGLPAIRRTGSPLWSPKPVQTRPAASGGAPREADAPVAIIDEDVLPPAGKNKKERAVEDQKRTAAEKPDENGELEELEPLEELSGIAEEADGSGPGDIGLLASEIEFAPVGEADGDEPDIEVEIVDPFAEMLSGLSGLDGSPPGGAEPSGKKKTEFVAASRRNAVNCPFVKSAAPGGPLSGGTFVACYSGGMVVELPAGKTPEAGPAASPTEEADVILEQNGLHRINPRYFNPDRETLASLDSEFSKVIHSIEAFAVKQTARA
jgi:hypothetical protein